MSNDSESSPRVIETLEEVDIYQGASEKSKIISKSSKDTKLIITTIKQSGETEWGKMDCGWMILSEKTIKTIQIGGQLECRICSVTMGWKEWSAHSKAKKHRQKFSKSTYENITTIEQANKIIEMCAVGDGDVNTLLKEVIIEPPSGCGGRWTGPPPPSKEVQQKADPSTSSELEPDLTADQIAWQERAESHRIKISSESYNQRELPVVCCKPPDFCPPFGAGRGRMIF